MKDSELCLLKASLRYDQITGEIYRIQNGAKCVNWYKNHSGKTYGRLSVGGKSYLAHRVAILLVTGRWPCGQIDHKDGDGTNNAYSNLRVVSPAENQRNLRCYANSSSGLSGVSWVPKINKWIARIHKNKASHYLGLYETMLDAAAARISAANRFGFSHCHGRRREL